MKAAPQIGVCRYCGCTDDAPCQLAGGESCGWVTKLKTVCSKWSCTQAWMADRKRDRGRRRQELREMRELYWKRRREEQAQRKAARAKAAKGSAKRPKGRVA